MAAQYAASGLSRVEPSAAAGVVATCSSNSALSRPRSTRSSRTMPLTPWRAPYTLPMPAWRRASSTTPASDWLMTAVGPPPWATRILIGFMARLLLVGEHCERATQTRRGLQVCVPFAGRFHGHRQCPGPPTAGTTEWTPFIAAAKKLCESRRPALRSLPALSLAPDPNTLLLTVRPSLSPAPQASGDADDPDHLAPTA